MASFFGHSVAASAIGYAALGAAPPKRFWLFAVAAGFLPDIDVVGFAFGVDYASVLGHRGVTHSILFAIAAGAVFAGLTSTKHFIRYWAVFCAIALSHGVLDAMTTGGLGVGFFIPFSETRYFFPCHPILVSPIGIARFFSQWGLAVLQSEAIWIGIPALVVVAIRWLLSARRFRHKL